MENTGTAIEVASIVGLLPSGGTSAVTAAIGAGLSFTGTALNISLDIFDGNYGSAISRGAIYTATLGAGAAIDNVILKSEGAIPKSGGLIPKGGVSEKILKSNAVIYEKIGDRAREHIFENKTR